MRKDENEIIQGEHLNELTKEIDEKENYLNVLKNEIVSRENILKLNEDQLPKEYKRYEDEIKLRDKQIESLKNVLDDKKLHLENKNFKELAEAKNYIEELKKIEIYKDLKLCELAVVMDDRNKEIEKLNETIEIYRDNEKNIKNTTDKDEDIYMLNNKLKEYELKILSLSEYNKNKDDELLMMKSILEQEREVIKNNKFSLMTLERLSIENEEEKIKSLNLLQEKTDMENKLFSLKNLIQEIKDKFEIELKKKEIIINDNNQIDLLNKIKNQEDHTKNYKKSIGKLNKEKLELEEIILKQEEKVNELSNKFVLIEKINKEKNKELKENDLNIKKLIQIIEEQKRTINNLSSYSQTEDNHLGSEVALLKNHVKNLRKDLELKEIKLNASQLKNNSLREELKRLKLYGNNSSANIHEREYKKLSKFKQMKNNYNGEILPPLDNNESRKINVKTASSSGSRKENFNMNIEHDKEPKYNLDKNDNNFDEITNMMNKLLEEN